MHFGLQVLLSIQVLSYVCFLGNIVLCTRCLSDRSYHLFADSLCLSTSELSFYDDFRVIDGIPVFVLEQQQDEKKRDNLIHCDSLSVDELDFRELVYNPFTVTCCQFSEDGRCLISGHRNGLVQLWDTVHGRSIALQENTHQTQVAACVFKAGKNRQHAVLSCCQSGRLVRWQLDDLRDEGKAPVFQDFKDDWNAESMKVDDALPSFSMDRELVSFCLETKDNWFFHLNEGGLVFASSEEAIAYEHILRRASFLYIYDSEQHDVRPQCRTKATITWEPNRNYKPGPCIFAPCDFKTRFIAGFRSPEHRGFVCLWPDFEMAPQWSFKLSGSCGSWSSDGRKVVTWDPLSDVQSRDKANVCRVWMVDKLVSLPHNKINPGGMGLHPRFLPPDEDTHIVLQHDPGVRVLWCRHVDCAKPLLASCTLGNEVRMLIWDLDVVVPIHVLATLVHRGISTEQWAEQLVQGRSSIAVSDDGMGRIGCYMGISKQGFIWDGLQGIQYLNFSLPDELVDNKSGLKVEFSPDGSKFLTYGSDKMLVWNTPPFQQDRHAGMSACMMGTEHETLNPLKSGLFSLDGTKIGLLQAGCDIIFVWDFVARQMLGLHRMAMNESVVASDLFNMFNFSLDGNRIVSCMDDGEILIWPLSLAEQVQSVNQTTSTNKSVNAALVKGNRRYERIGSIRQTCQAISFSKDEDGQESIVACRSDGKLCWIVVDSKKLVKTKRQEGPLACKFSNDGTRGALFQQNGESITVKIWDLVGKTQLREIVYGISLQCLVGLPGGVSMDASFAVVGIHQERDRPVIFQPRQLAHELKIDRVSQNVIISDDGRWVTADEDFRASVAFMGSHSSRHALTVGAENAGISIGRRQRLSVMPVHGTSPAKHVEGQNLDPNRFMVVSPDGTKNRLCC